MSISPWDDVPHAFITKVKSIPLAAILKLYLLYEFLSGQDPLCSLTQAYQIQHIGVSPRDNMFCAFMTLTFDHNVKIFHMDMFQGFFVFLFLDNKFVDSGGILGKFYSQSRYLIRQEFSLRIKKTFILKELSTPLVQLSRSTLFHSYRDVTTVGAGLQNLSPQSALTVFDQRGVFSMTLDFGLHGLF